MQLFDKAFNEADNVLQSKNYIGLISLTQRRKCLRYLLFLLNEMFHSIELNEEKQQERMLTA